MTKIIPSVGDLEMKADSEWIRITFSNVGAGGTAVQDVTFSNKYRWAMFEVGVASLNTSEPIYIDVAIRNVYFDSDGKISGVQVWVWNRSSGPQNITVDLAVNGLI